MRLLCVIPVLALAACKPPPTDEAGSRGTLVEFPKGPSKPIDSPDSENAIWAASATEGRIIYGNPGEAPMLALACVDEGAQPKLEITRFALADEGAGAFMALVGNSHIARVPVDAVPSGTAFIWSGQIDTGDPDIEVLTGQRPVTVTVPGAGMITLNPSERPRELIEQCRGPVTEDLEPDPEISEDAEPAL